MLDRILTATIGATGAAVATQFPAYYQQYLQNFAGNIAGTQKTIADLERAKTDVPPAIAERLATWSEQLGWARSASAIEQPYVLSRIYDQDIGREAWHLMEFALPLSLNGLIYALIGMLAALTIWAIVRGLPRQLARAQHWLRSHLILRVRGF